MHVDEWKELIMARGLGMSSEAKMGLGLLVDILEELRAIRQATETEAVEDADPDPYQTLNGP